MTKIPIGSKTGLLRGLACSLAAMAAAGVPLGDAVAMERSVDLAGTPWADPGLGALAAVALAASGLAAALWRDRGRPRLARHVDALGRASVMPHDLGRVPAAAVHAALDHMREGLVLYDEQERLVMCNRRYAEIYRLPPDLARVGTPFTALLDYWSGIGLLDGADNRRKRVAASLADGPSRIELQLGDGRIIELNEHPFPEGGWVATHEDITERRRAEDEAHRLARRDPLTGLLNRFTFDDEMALRLAPLAAGQTDLAAPPQAVVVVDLDRFKKVNDLFGHAAGDALLVAVAARLVDRVGPSGRVARLGCDEFAVLVPCFDRADLNGFVEALVREISRPYTFGTVAADIGASACVALAPDHGCEPSRLLARADRALREAKAAGGGRVEIYSPALDAREAERRDLVRDLGRAIADGGLALVFQPIADAADGTIVGGEALLRWNHPRQGNIPPERIIAVAEESGLIHPLGVWILDTALEAAAGWPAHVAVSVNLSALQFRSEEIVGQIERSLVRSGVAPHRLELEVTETVLCDAEAAATMDALHALGVRLALDDFGTGWASLSYLLRFPFDRIKIDRSFVSGAADRPRNRSIVEAVGNLAGSLGLQVVAEGVESDAERDVVRAAGCRFAQGWLFGRPVPAAVFAAALGVDEPETAPAVAPPRRTADVPCTV